jgi:hypothetical protein
MAVNEKSAELTMQAAAPDSTLQISRSNLSGTWMHRHDNADDLPRVHVSGQNVKVMVVPSVVWLCRYGVPD